VALFFLLLGAVAARGAYFVHYGGGYEAYGHAHAFDPYYFDGPYEQTYNDIYTASANISAAVGWAFGSAYNKMGASTTGNSTYIRGLSIADGAADVYGCFCSGKGYCSTKYPGTLGVFYKIEPGFGESAGDDVIVHFSATANVWGEASTYVLIGGPGGMDHMSVTRGQLPPVTTQPDPSYEVVTFPNLEYFNPWDQSWFSGVHSFPAQIGDVIGVFVRNHTMVEGNGPWNGRVRSTVSMVLTAESVLAGDLDKDGDVDFFDLAKFAANWLVDTTP
jgi:hypothetical protein